MRIHRLTALLAATLLSATTAAATEVRVTIENLAPENGNFLTPVWVGFHDGTFDSYDGGSPLRGTIERIAEDGDTGPVTAEFDAQFGTPQGTIPGPSGPIGPGESATMIFDLDERDPAVRFFSYVSMVIPSNDAFIANGPPAAHRVFDSSGNLTPFSFVVRGDNGGVNDAGTEVNTELPEHTAFFGQMAPDTGIEENGVVTTFTGFLPRGSGGILDAERFAAATTGRPGYEVARITVEAVRSDRTRFGADASQEVPPNQSGAIADCTATLEGDETRLQVTCIHDVAEPQAAHVHLAPRGENGPVIFPFDSAESPVSGTFDVSPEDVDNLRAGNFYVNIHSTTYPAGEVRGQIDTCISGPASLCLNDSRFMVTANWQTADATGQAKGFELTEDSGVLYFFRDTNIELDVKVLDNCDRSGFYWVLAAGLTNQGVELIVEDTLTGQRQTYTNPLDNPFQPILDTRAFATCP